MFDFSRIDIDAYYHVTFTRQADAPLRSQHNLSRRQKCALNPPGSSHC